MDNLGFNKPIKDTKIAVAMSGGVDSSVVAVMMKKLGYNVTGFTMKLYNQVDRVNSNKTCCAGKDINDAVEVAKQYNFEHRILEYQANFFEGVIDNFVESYSKGRTPVPCITCNQTVKFTDMLAAAKQINADALATGHYARRVGGMKDAKLFRAKDKIKDQSYFLFATTQSQLDYLRFPLGKYRKEEIRKFAKELNLDVKDKPDSQDICFITDGSYSDFIKKINPDSFIDGDILNLDGKIIGRHKGIVNYTVGQRRKIGIGGNVEPLYVVEINAKNNTIAVGSRRDLRKSQVTVIDLNWLSGVTQDNVVCDARIKSDQTPEPGKIIFSNKNTIKFEFDNPQYSVAPGQACVFYSGDEVLGGGWIKV